MARLNEATITKTMAAADTVVLTQANGDIVRINKADLAEAIRSVMPVATTTSNGLMSAGNARALNAVSFAGGPSNAATEWLRIGTLTAGYYNALRLLIDVGTWNSTSRTKIDLTLVKNGNEVVAAGSSGARVGYVLFGENMDIYIKSALGESVICSWIGAPTWSETTWVSVEPAGIVYIP